MGIDFDPATGDLVAPGESDELAPESYSGTLGAKVATALFSLFLVGLIYLFSYSLYLGLQATFQPDGSTAQSLETSAQGITSGALFAESAGTLVMLGLVPAAWVIFTRVKPRLGTLIYLRLDQARNAARDLLRGAGLGMLLLISLLVIAVVRLAITGDLDALSDENATADSPLIEAFGRVMTWPLALFMAFSAAVAEEIFFRGILQRWMGWLGQSVVFGLTHASYGTVDQILFPLALGLLFGWLIKRGHSLYLVIAAHFVFNFVQFGIMAAS